MDSTAEELWESMTPAQRELVDMLTRHCNCPYFDWNAILCPSCADRGRGLYLGDRVWDAGDVESKPK